MIDDFAVTTDTVKSALQKGEQLFFVNVRHHTDWDTGLLKARGALRIPDDEVEKHLDEIPADRTVIIYSTCGDTASVAAAKALERHGRKDVHPLLGGFKSYLEAGLPVQEIDRDRSTMRKLMFL